MLPLNDITQLAIKVQSATAERENTAVRVGTAIAELCKYVNQLPTVAGFSFVASANGVDLVIKTLTENGQEASTAVAVPLLSAEKAGMLTPQMLTALRSDLRKDFSNFEKQVRGLIEASEEVMSRSMGELEKKAGEAETAISQLNSDISRLYSFVRTFTNEEREAVEQLLGAIDKTDNGQKIYYLSRYISDDALAMLRAKYPMLRIEQPEYTVVEYQDDIANGTFASNHDNRTGFKFNKPYVCSGHVQKILDERCRVAMYRAADGVKRFVRLNPDNPLVALTGETISYVGDSSWPFVLEPDYWYKGINDHLNARHFAVFAYGKTEPHRPQGVRLSISQWEATQGKRVSGNDTFTNYAQVLEVLYDRTAYKVSVAGHRFARIPASGSADDAIVVCDASGVVIARVVPFALEGIYEGSYVVIPLPEGADFVAFSLPTILPNILKKAFVWLTSSDRPEDWEPDWVFHPRRFNAFQYCKWDNDTASGTVNYTRNRAFIGLRSGTAPYGVTLNDLLKNPDYCLNGYEGTSYEDFKDLMQLYYARYGKRNAENTFTSGVNAGVENENVYNTPHEAYTVFQGFGNLGLTKLPNGTEVRTKESFFMGYVFTTAYNSCPFFDAKLTYNGVFLGKNMSATGRQIPFPLEVYPASTLKHHANGRYLDITPVAVSNEISTSDYYACAVLPRKSFQGEVLALRSTYERTHIGNVGVNNNNIYLHIGVVRLSCPGDDCVEVDSYSKLFPEILPD